MLPPDLIIRTRSMIRKQRAGFHSGFWFVFPPCPQFITAYTAAVFKADKVVPVPRAASVQELLAGARGWVKEEPRALAPTRPGIRPLVTQPRDICLRDPITRCLAVKQCHEIVAVTTAPSKCELSASSRGRFIMPSLYTRGRARS